MSDNLRRGVVREDGRVFHGYRRTLVDGVAIVKERWISKETYEKDNQRIKTRYHNKREEIIAQVRQWRAENPERMRAQLKAWKVKNFMANKEIELRAYAKKRGASNEIAPEDRPIFYAMFAAAKRIEQCVGVKMSIDHIVPISKGGRHCLSNLQILPKNLNSAKYNKTNSDLRYWGVAA